MGSGNWIILKYHECVVMVTLNYPFFALISLLYGNGDTQKILVLYCSHYYYYPPLCFLFVSRWNFWLPVSCMLCKWQLLLELDRYQESSRFKKMRYEDDFLRYLQNIMADVDRRIRRGHARLNLSRAQEEKVCCNYFLFKQTNFYIILR